MLLLKKTQWFLPLLSVAIFGQHNRVVDSLSQNTPAKKLEEVVVSDSRFPFKRSQSGKPIIKINSKNN